MTARLLTANEVAEALAVSVATVRRWERSGVLRGVRIGRVLRFRAADVDALIDGHSSPMRATRRAPVAPSDVPLSHHRRGVTPADPVLAELGLPEGASLTDVLEATRRRDAAA